MPKSEYHQAIEDCMAALRDHNKVASWPGYRLFPYPQQVYIEKAYCEMLAEYLHWQVGSTPFEESSRE